MASGQWKWNRRNQHLSKRQYVWSFGVFAWGTGAFLFFALGLPALENAGR
jgi:hypothetical protein